MIKSYKSLSEAMIEVGIGVRQHRRTRIAKYNGVWYVRVGNKDIRKWPNVN